MNLIQRLAISLLTLALIALSLSPTVSATITGIAHSDTKAMTELNAAAVPGQEVALPEEIDWSSIPAHFMVEQSNQTNNHLQVFDVAKGSVVLSVANSPDFQSEAKKWLGNITSLAPEVQPDMKATYIVRIPLDPAQPLKVGHVMLNVKELYLFYYNDTSKEPLLLTFDENRHPYFFHIQQDVTPFIKQLAIPH